MRLLLPWARGSVGSLEGAPRVLGTVRDGDPIRVEQAGSATGPEQR